MRLEGEAISFAEIKVPYLSLGISKVITIHYERDMKISTKFHDNPVLTDSTAVVA